MIITNYKVTGHFAGVVFAQYKNGHLVQLLAELESTQPVGDVPPGWDMFPLLEFDLRHSEVLTATEIKGRSVADKVALFCLVYYRYKGQPYRAMKEEKANMGTVSVTPQLLDSYFTHTAYPLSHNKSMADYVRHYNTVRDLAHNGVPKKSAFPDYPDSEYEKTLSPEKLSAYRVHLVSLGWKKVDGLWQQS